MMNLRALQPLALALVLLVNEGAPSLLAQSEHDSSATMTDKRASELRCSISTNDSHWKLGVSGNGVSVEVQLHGNTDSTIMPSLHLVAITKNEGSAQDEYWAPFRLKDGASTKEWQQVGTGEQNRPPTRVLPLQISWAPTKSSVWPAETLANVVPPGTYYLQAQMEIRGHNPVVSNKIEITVLR
jgi:hypothetical protein